MEAEQLYTFQELATMFRVSVGALRKWRAAGKLEVIQLPGGLLRVREEEVRRILTPSGPPQAMSAD